MLVCLVGRVATVALPTGEASCPQLVLLVVVLSVWCVLGVVLILGVCKVDRNLHLCWRVLP